MNAEILINVTPMETRVALVEQGLLQEIHIERRHRLGPMGNIYMGRVARVMPGMQAAFVDVGLERAAFIHAADIRPVNQENDEEGEDGQADIARLVKEGQFLAVQVAKEPIAGKGARLTTQLSLASRYLVYMPGNGHRGVSRRIEGEEERNRLLAMLESGLEKEAWPGPGGFILRTAAEQATESELLADIRYLRRLWHAVSRDSRNRGEIRVIYRDPALHVRAMRDLLRPPVTRVRIDDARACDEVRAFVGEFIPEIAARIELYEEERPLFDLYGVDDEIERALSRTVKLKSGGNLVIDQNEAMTTIDVNTGAFLGSRNPEETILKTNLEAAKAGARQIRIRNLGGIIILDFIDMQDPEHRRQVLRTLNKALEKDLEKTKIITMSKLGLVEMTRKRSRESLEQMLCRECPTCEGRGTIKTPETVCHEVFREIMRVAKAFEHGPLLVMASQEVVDRLLDEESSTVAELEELIHGRISFQVESIYTTDQFDVVPY